MAPRGVPILRPPANPLPPGTEWQATQSAVRAKYSSPSSGRLALPGSRRLDLGPDARTRQANTPPAHSTITPLRTTARETTFTSQLPGRCRSMFLFERPAPLGPRRDANCGRISLCRSTEICIHNWQRSNALARRGEDRIGHCRGEGRNGRLARAAPDISAAGHQMHVDPRRLRKAHHTKSIEIALQRRTILDRDLAVQCGAQTKDHGALSLLGDGLRIDHVTGIEHDGDPIHFHSPVRLHRNFRNLRAEAIRKIADGDAAPTAFWQRLTPVPLLGRPFQPLGPGGLALQQLAPHVIGINPARRGDFVQETFDGKDILIATRRAIEPDRQVSIPEVHFHTRVWHVVAVTNQALDRWRLSFVGRERNAVRLEDGRGYDTH